MFNTPKMVMDQNSRVGENFGESEFKYIFIFIIIMNLI